MSSVDTFLEVTLETPEDFLKIKETLTRIGIASKKENRLYQSCHILHKRNKYYIVHFKELFLLDGKHADFTVDDAARRNTIAHLLHEWGLLTIVSKDEFEQPTVPLSNIKILSHKEKQNWLLESKYTVGKRRG
jgi:hypothetical protein